MFLSIVRKEISYNGLDFPIKEDKHALDVQCFSRWRKQSMSPGTAKLGIHIFLFQVLDRTSRITLSRSSHKQAKY